MPVFELKDEHIMLMRRMYVNWNDAEFGAPEIDPKRPYGNSDGISDIAEILEVPTIHQCEHCDGIEYSKEHKEKMETLHKETKQALQILLQHGEVKTGTYVGDTYSDNWRPEKD